jgi:hypothetical protein
MLEGNTNLQCTIAAGQWKVDGRCTKLILNFGGVIMKLKTIERSLAVLLLVVWVLLLMRAHTLNPNSFFGMEAIIILGSLAVLIVVIMSFATKHPLPVQKKAEETVTTEPTNK